MSRGFHENDFESRSHGCPDKVSGDRTTVSFAQNDMNVDRRIAIRALGYVPGERGDFHLALNRNWKIALLLPVEISKLCILKRANCTEACCRKLRFSGKRLQARENVVASRENDRKVRCSDASWIILVFISQSP